MSRKRARTTDLTPSSSSSSSTVSSSWRTMKNQMSLGSEYVRIEPQGTWPTTKVKYLEFEIPSNKVFKFDTKSFFEVTGKFKRLETKTNAGGQSVSTWRNVDLNDLKLFVLKPNWFEFLIKSVDVVHGNQIIATHNMPANLLPIFNTLLYRYMDKKVKDLIAPNPLHPAHTIPSQAPWTPEDADWKTYFTKMVASTPLEFEWIPLNVWPFSQNLNHCLNEPQQPLPTGHFEKLFIRITFIDDFKTIFKTKNDTDKNNFDFELTGMHLVLEEDKLAPMVHIPKRNLAFPGHSFSCRYENIPAGESTYKTRFLKSAMPMQLGILAVDKKYLAGSYDYREVNLAEEGGFKYLKKTNLKYVNMLYNGHELSTKIPNFQHFKGGTISTLVLRDALKKNGLFTMQVDPDLITYVNCKNEFAGTPFPFNLVDYTLQDGTQSRIYPTDASLATTNVFAKDEVIEITLTFGTGGATDGVIYFLIFVFNGISLTFDVDRNQFVNIFENSKSS